MSAKHFLALGLWLGLLAGCDSSPAQTFPVRGRVLLDGRPLSSGTILFEPVSRKEDSPAYSARAPIQAGAYQLSMFGSNDGAAAGEYQVAILVPHTGGSSEAGGDFVPPPPKLTAYGSIHTSNLTATIVPEESANLDVNFELTSQ